MSQSSYAASVVAKPIRVLIIRPDDTYEIRVIEQELSVLQEIVGGYVEDINTPHGVFWTDEEGKLKHYPENVLATYLWWNLCPAMEGHDMLQGTVFVTGNADGEWSEPVSDEVIAYFEEMRTLYEENKRRDEEG